jgi:hypothetical protein
VDFSEEERNEYRIYEETALKFYRNFRRRHLKTLSKHFLKLSAKLNQLRVACAGGYVPLLENDDTDGMDQEDEHSDDELELDVTPKKKCKKVVQFSDFAFKAKFRKLIEELEYARDNDPTCTLLLGLSVISEA